MDKKVFKKEFVGKNKSDHDSEKCTSISYEKRHSYNMDRNHSYGHSEDIQRIDICSKEGEEVEEEEETSVPGKKPMKTTSKKLMHLPADEAEERRLKNNENERIRTHAQVAALQRLGQALPPSMMGNRKWSKQLILSSAITYIRFLDDLIGNKGMGKILDEHGQIEDAGSDFLKKLQLVKDHMGREWSLANTPDALTTSSLSSHHSSVNGDINNNNVNNTESEPHSCMFASSKHLLSRDYSLHEYQNPVRKDCILEEDSLKQAFMTQQNKCMMKNGAQIQQNVKQFVHEQRLQPFRTPYQKYYSLKERHDQQYMQQINCQTQQNISYHRKKYEHQQQQQPQQQQQQPPQPQQQQQQQPPQPQQQQQPQPQQQQHEQQRQAHCQPPLQQQQSSCLFPMKVYPSIKDNYSPLRQDYNLHRHNPQDPQELCLTPSQQLSSTRQILASLKRVSDDVPQEFQGTGKVRKCNSSNFLEDSGYMSPSKTDYLDTDQHHPPSDTKYLLGNFNDHQDKNPELPQIKTASICNILKSNTDNYRNATSIKHLPNPGQKNQPLIKTVNSPTSASSSQNESKFAVISPNSFFEPGPLSHPNHHDINIKYNSSDNDESTTKPLSITPCHFSTPKMYKSSKSVINNSLTEKTSAARNDIANSHGCRISRAFEVPTFEHQNKNSESKEIDELFLLMPGSTMGEICERPGRASTGCQNSIEDVPQCEVSSVLGDGLASILDISLEDTSQSIDLTDGLKEKEVE